MAEILFDTPLAGLERIANDLGSSAFESRADMKRDVVSRVHPRAALEVQREPAIEKILHSSTFKSNYISGILNKRADSLHGNTIFSVFLETN